MVTAKGKASAICDLYFHEINSVNLTHSRLQIQEQLIKNITTSSGRHGNFVSPLVKNKGVNLTGKRKTTWIQNSEKKSSETDIEGS